MVAREALPQVYCLARGTETFPGRRDGSAAQEQIVDECEVCVRACVRACVCVCVCERESVCVCVSHAMVTRLISSAETPARSLASCRDNIYIYIYIFLLAISCRTSQRGQLPPMCREFASEASRFRRRSVAVSTPNCCGFALEAPRCRHPIVAVSPPKRRGFAPGWRRWPC